MLTHLGWPLFLLCRGHFFYISLARRQSDQSLIAITGDSDNSLSISQLKRPGLKTPTSIPSSGSRRLRHSLNSLRFSETLSPTRRQEMLRAEAVRPPGRLSTPNVKSRPNAPLNHFIKRRNSGDRKIQECLMFAALSVH